MKYLKIFTLNIALFAFLFGCEEQLMISPQTSIAPSELGQQEVPQMLNGILHSFQNAPGQASFIMFDMAGGNTETDWDEYQEISENRIDVNNDLVRQNWDGLFEGLYRTNLLLERLAELDDNASNSEAKGVAHYFRAYTYYNLVTRWGDVPIIKENTREKVARDSEQDVWAFIEEELQQAISLAPPASGTSSYYYVSREAAEALMARVALARENWSQGESLAEGLINSGMYSLEDDYSAIFEKENTNTETIFALRNMMGEGNTIGRLFVDYGWPTVGSDVLEAPQDLLDTYENDSLRYKETFIMFDDEPMCTKYLGGAQGGDHIIISRIAEMYLISAEAKARLMDIPGGLDRLNELRQQRGLDDLDISDMDQFMEAVLRERRTELVYEGFRFYDLVRTNRAIDEVPTITAEYQKLFPIPQRELNLNENLQPQNMGY
ncbi:MAG: RagB/SusD family nutrient uptake outer membrane protein [Candidatus Marinimicrobia bacterium]|nr:RagB/SusD family nutrient uptake outer membrane protein [Candidatus Neomarinimicrobiota bacterium]